MAGSATLIYQKKSRWSYLHKQPVALELWDLGTLGPFLVQRCDEQCRVGSVGCVQECQSNETPENIHFLGGLGTKTYFAQISAIGQLVDSFFAVVWQFSLPRDRDRGARGILR